MTKFLNKITLSKNSRGCYILDTVKGCKHNCYGECYAKKIADRYGKDFSSLVDRKFTQDKYKQECLFGFCNSEHEKEIIHQINKADMPFIRIGEMGDPSFNWEHTLNICKVISQAEKPIVIITKHWEIIPDNILRKFKKMNITINTSVSALDSNIELIHRLKQYYRLQKYCNSVLRVVTCNFDITNKQGAELLETQCRLLEKEKVINTVFRPSKDNELIKSGVIKVSKVKFLKSKVLASVWDKDTYMGNCKNCPDMCGVNL